MKKKILLVSTLCLFCCIYTFSDAAELTLNQQPLSSFETLWTNYKTEVSRSQYETQLQYEARVQSFFDNEPLRYFDLQVTTYYDVENQEFFVMIINNNFVIDCIEATPFSTTMQQTPVGEYYTDDLVIDDVDKLGLSKTYHPEYSSIIVFLVYKSELSPIDAEVMASNIGLRVGIEFRYRPEGMVCSEKSSSWHDYLLGSLRMVTLYNKQNNSIYFQNNFLELNNPPVSNAGNNQIVIDQIILNGNQSSDPDHDIVSYQWQIQHRGNSLYNRVATGVNPIIPNLYVGFYDVILTVTDDKGNFSTSNMFFSATGNLDATRGDATNNGKVGLEDAIYILQMVSGDR